MDPGQRGYRAFTDGRHFNNTCLESILIEDNRAKFNQILNTDFHCPQYPSNLVTADSVAPVTIGVL